MKDYDVQAALIRSSLITIALKAPSDARHLIEEYVPLLSPGLAPKGDSNLPIAAVRSPVNPERCGVEVGKHSLLLFHAGNAVMAYYASVIDGAATLELMRRAELLAQIASRGMAAFTIGGTVQKGFYLLNPEVDALLENKYAKKAETRTTPPKLGGKAK